MAQSDSNFIRFKKSIDHIELPKEFNNPFDYEPHALCIQASQEVQERLQTNNLDHNFGLSDQGMGKMFGVLVVKNANSQIGYLAAFSGNLKDSNHHPGFVPSVFDGLETGAFLDLGMKELDRINQQIQQLESSQRTEIETLKKSRTDHSNSLQDGIYDGYLFLNQSREEKSLREIFAVTHHSNPPGGAGDCAAPKLLQYAFQHGMQPLSIAEFWWGRSKAPQWQHRHFYPACKHKCEPILKHMLKGLVADKELVNADIT